MIMMIPYILSLYSTSFLFMVHCFSVQYFLLVVLIFILEIVAGILAFVYRMEIESVVTKELYKGINTKYPAEGSSDEEGLRTGWHAVQTHVSLDSMLFV